MLNYYISAKIKKMRTECALFVLNHFQMQRAQAL